MDIVAVDFLGHGDSKAPNQPNLYTEEEVSLNDSMHTYNSKGSALLVVTEGRVFYLLYYRNNAFSSLTLILMLCVQKLIILLDLSINISSIFKMPMSYS